MIVRAIRIKKAVARRLGVSTASGDSFVSIFFLATACPSMMRRLANVGICDSTTRTDSGHVTGTGTICPRNRLPGEAARLISGTLLIRSGELRAMVGLLPSQRSTPARPHTRHVDRAHLVRSSELRSMPGGYPHRDKLNVPSERVGASNHVGALPASPRIVSGNDQTNPVL